MEYKNPVKKIIPSKIETGFQKFLYCYVGKHIPEKMTPNQMTLIGALGGVLAIAGAFLTILSKWYFIAVIIGLLIHLTADDLDGYIARTRGMSSKAGAYFDLITDVMISTFLIIAFGFSPYGNMGVMIFAVPLYGVVNVTAMNYIIYFNEFRFPRLGPIEAHITYGLMAVLSMILGNKAVITICGIRFMIADVIIAVGLIPMYYEMIRLQIQLFCRLRKQEKI